MNVNNAGVTVSGRVEENVGRYGDRVFGSVWRQN